MSLSVISRDRDSCLSSYFNGKSMVRGAGSNNDLSLWWCQWLLQVESAIVFEKSLKVEVIQVSSVRDGKKFHSLQRLPLLYHRK